MQDQVPHKVQVNIGDHKNLEVHLISSCLVANFTSVNKRLYVICAGVSI